MEEIKLEIGSEKSRINQISSGCKEDGRDRSEGDSLAEIHQEYQRLLHEKEIENDYLRSRLLGSNN